MGEHVQGQAGADRAVGRPGPAARMVTTEAVRRRPSVLIEPVAPYVEPAGGNGSGPPDPAVTPDLVEAPAGPAVAAAVTAAVTAPPREDVSPSPVEVAPVAAPGEAVPAGEAAPDHESVSGEADATAERVEDPVAAAAAEPVATAPAEPVAPAGADAAERARLRVRLPRPTRQPVTGPRAARVFVTHVEPWSVMKQAFLLSLALAVILVIATASVWYVLDSAGVLEAITRTASDVGGESAASVGSFLSFGKVMGVAMVLAGVETVLVTALATLFAFMYNLAVGIGGGLEITIAEED